MSEEPQEPPEGARRKLAALVGDDFDVMDVIGGWRGLAESVAPGPVFVVVFVIADQQMAPALIAALATAFVAMLVRLVQRTPVTQALSGLVGVAIGVVWAWWTGRAADYFVGGLITNLAYAVGFIVSIVVGWPLVGVIAAVLRQEGTAWKSRPVAYRKALWATWLWVAMFAVRLAVQVPLWMGGDVPWLGTARLVMGVPLFALVVYLSWWLLREPAQHPAPDDPPESS